jgi:hypothetical protein
MMSFSLSLISPSESDAAIDVDVAGRARQVAAAGVADPGAALLGDLEQGGAVGRLDGDRRGSRRRRGW